MVEHVFFFDEPQPSRLDKFLTRAFDGAFSRSQIQRWIKEGRVTVDGQVVTKTGFRLEEPCRVAIDVPPPRPSALRPEPIPLDILFENEDVLILNKPAGMVVHPSPGHWEGTLVHAALAHIPDLAGVGGELRPGIVHRLDKDTSGVMVIAKNDAAHRYLQDQFRNREAKKEYLGLVDGAPPTPKGKIEAPLERDPKDRRKMRVVPLGRGKEAVTLFEVVERFPQHTLVRYFPITGRTHQIRVHSAFIGAPIVGDTLYGRKKPTLPVERHLLHAHRLTLRLPGEDAPRTFEAPLPEDFLLVLRRLRINTPKTC